ncbi:MAG: nucleotidyltransferase substrate binding protein [bacterium]|nr:nucleotidyltransferase substrate binding protein [bacterium]
MNAEDIRWIQRYNHFNKALSQLTKFIDKGELNELEKQGLIQAFEYTYELVWNTIKDYFETQGEIDIHGSRDAFRLAFRRGLIEDGKTWMDMIKSRTLTTHTYNEDIAEEISTTIANKYYPEFVALQTKLRNIKEKTTDESFWA